MTAEPDRPTAGAFGTAGGGVVLVALAASLWGTVGVASKGVYAIAEVTPLFVGFLRLALAVPALLALSLLFVGWRTFAFRGRDLGIVLLIGVTMALYQLFYFTAVATTGVAIATLVTICTAPLIVALLSGVLLGEALTRPVALALLLGLSGTVLLVGFPDDVGVDRAAVFAGVAWALGSALSYAVFVLCSRALAPRHHPFTLIAVGFGAGAVMLLPFALHDIPDGSLAVEALVLLLYIGLVPTAFAYVLYFRGMKRTGATVASVAALMEPLTATLLAWALFDERLGPVGLLGGALLLIAILLLGRASRRSAVRP